MRSRLIRLGIFISTLIIAAIIIFQLTWLRKVYNYEQKQFDQSIGKALRNFYEDIHFQVDPNYNLNQLILNPNSQTYIAKILQPVKNDSLAFYMQNELEEENIFTDCHFGIYNAAKKQYIFRTFLESATDTQNEVDTLPHSSANFNYIILYFPHRKQYILSLMSFWITTSILLLIVLILFSSGLYYFYRQSFLNELQKDFVNNFTHEFKTPVAVLNLASEVLDNPDITKKPERLSKYAAIVKYQSKHLQNQIERLLKYAYSESHHLQLKKERLDLHLLIEEAIDNLQPLIEEKHACIKYEFEAKNNYLNADHGYLLIVITNLIENALKYSREPKIIIRTYNDNGHIILSVKDNGKGIEKKYQSKIFKRFYRVPDGEQTAARGFGLGLSFAKRIVNAHHGKINLESIAEVGSNFIIKLPVS